MRRNPFRAPLLLLAALLPAGAATIAAPREIMVSGRAVDAEGIGVEGVAVRLLETRRDFVLADWEFEDSLRSQLLTRTDADGFFEARAVPDPDYRYFWLRFYDPETFDAVRYKRPEDRDVTHNVRKGRPAILTVVLEDHPDWPRVKRWIERLGADTPRGRLVRQLGVPDRREEAEGVETFWYARIGTIYRFQDGEYIGEERWVESEGSAALPADS